MRMNARKRAARLLAMTLTAVLLMGLLPLHASLALEETDVPLGATDLRVQEEMANQQQAARKSDFEDAGMAGSLFADFYFSGVQTLHGIFSSIGLYADVPDYATPTSAILRLSYTSSDLVLSGLSSLTFYMNGTPFHSCQVSPGEDNAPTVIYVSVPVELMQQGYNLLEISSYVRLTDDEGCTDDYNGANWVKIADSTCLRIAYDVVENAGEIAMFPYPFLSLMDKTGAQCAIVTSDKAANEELTAAMSMMAALGTEVSSENQIAFGRLSEARRAHTIYFGLKDNTPEELLSLLDQEVPPTGALINRVAAGGAEYLLVVSQEPDALLEAARLLGDASRVSQVHDVTTHVSTGEAQAFIDAGRMSALALEGQYTLKDILGHGASFSGPFHQEVTLYLPVAEDYALSSESRFSLKIRYSENLDFDRSLMTVYWGGSIPLVSRKLTKEGSAGETVSFAVPADAVGASSTSMTIVFDLEVKDLDCTPRQLNMPWAYVAEDSTFFLPQGETSALSLSNRPAPFQRGSRLNQVEVVLSNQPTAAELLLAGRTMSMIGAGSNPYGELRVIRASEFDPADADYNLIVVGMGSDNALLRKLNDKLYFRFTEDMKAVASNDKLILDEDYARQVGTVQLLPSPYVEGRALLALSAPEEAGITAVTDRISTERKRWALTREAVLMDGHGKATSYQFSTTVSTSVDEEKPTFTRVLVENREPMLFLLVGMGCMLVVLLAVILVLVRIRMTKKQE